MAEKINLDALIPRADLAAINSDPRGKRKDTISAVDLKENAFFLLNLYKPDFQRETTEWDSKKTKEFIKSFLTDELIPAIILWQGNSGNIFVIDGAHRLSALIAWINDDYGDGAITRKVFGKNISEEQTTTAEKLRASIEKEIGAYSRFEEAMKNPDSYKEDVVKTARNLSSLAVQLQWVEGDVMSAERSFFNINQKASPINKTEMKLIQNRKNPIGIAARAIMSSGLGHKYWSAFPEDNQKEIEMAAKEIHDILFLPKLQIPIKTTDVPMCGKYNSSALPTIFDFLELCVHNDSIYQEDIDGGITIKCLKQARKIARLINSKHESSLGLHPLVYFYAESGAFKVASFYAVAHFVNELDIRGKKDDFTAVRSSFEKVYLDSASVIQFLVRKARSAKNSTTDISNFLVCILQKLTAGIESDEVLSELRKEERYKDIPSDARDYDSNDAIDFTAAKKSEIFIRDSISTIPRCALCGGYLHMNSISIDHITRKQDGGLGNVDNGQLTHPYCNTGYKN